LCGWDAAPAGRRNREETEVTDILVSTVEEEVRRILAAGNADPEVTHSDLDKLVHSVIHAIANGVGNERALAEALLPLIDNETLILWYA
jgi:hypothetical protein